MPNSKAKVWKRTMAKHLWEKYFNNATSLPNYKRKRAESPNAAANRKAMKDEMEKRKMKIPRTNKQGGGKIKLNLMQKYKDINAKKYEEEKELYLKMNYKQRINFLKAEARKKWEEEKKPQNVREEEQRKEEEKKREEEKRKKLEEEIRRQEEEKRKNEEKRKQEEKKRREEERKRKREEEDQKRQQQEEERKRQQQEEERKRKQREEQQQKKLRFRIPTGEFCVDVMELGDEQTWENTRKQFLKLSIKYHPDKCNGDGEAFKKMKAAYDILKKHFQK